ncbi:DcaP family trimeric outer membrane transporter [Polycyclovorans algicola]|uniref:DcaP family trimeric outer membrane transporter n=1 Tax=Polycyclovorans algicola TaxID=616992 RepID=UPI0004A74119|nr:DcaP family trimeric outer membrane transporter [Polycyclovorans algicola]
MIKKHAIAVGAAAFMALAASPAQAFKTTIGNTEVTLGGFVKLDFIYSQNDPGSNADLGRDFYVPGLIPVGNAQSSSRFDAHAKETRLIFATNTDFNGYKVGSYIEADFIVNQGTPGADERITNAYNPGLRRAFVTFGGFLAGQDWSTFQNLVALPETLDFVAWPSDGTPFMRQALLRYTTGGLDLSLENPQTTVTDGMGARISEDENTLPDLHARYRFSVGSAQMSVAALARQLKTDGNGAETGYAVSVAGKIPLGKNDIRFTISQGDGAGRYLALNTVNDAQIAANGDLEAIEVINGFIAYRQVWTEKWRSTLALSAFSADHDTALTGTGVTKSVQSASVNLLYSPVPPLTVGGELRYAEREVENGDEGDLTRFQFSVKYSF